MTDLFLHILYHIMKSKADISGLPRVPGGEGNGNPLQYSCLGNPVDRGAWQATVHGVTKSQTGLRDFHFSETRELGIQRRAGFSLAGGIIQGQKKGLS